MKLFLGTILIMATFVHTHQMDLPDCSIYQKFPRFVNNPLSCRSYWLCTATDSQPIQDKCPDGFHFNENKQMCNIPFDFPCEDSVMNPPDCAIIDGVPRFVNDPTNCNAYWYCFAADQPPTAMVCEIEEFNFNEASQLCEDPLNYPCENPEDPDPIDPTDAPTDPPDTPPTPPRNPCEDVADGRLVNDPTGCRSFFECRNEVALSRQCDMGLNFNEELQMCDRPTFTPCSNDDFKCPLYGISRWEVPGSCTDYNFCFGGQHRVQTCAPSLVFDSSISLCSLNVDCTRDLCPLTNDIDNIVTYPSENDCEQYYKCYDNNKELQYCAPGTHWNNERQRCEMPEDAECTITTTQPPDTTDPIDEPFECPPGEGPYFLPHTENCQYYFICFSGNPFERRCAEGLMFDNLLEQCNFADLVQCPDPDGSTQRITKQRNHFMRYITGIL